jgi:uncharacterized protein (DUF2147 family)
VSACLALYIADTVTPLPNPEGVSFMRKEYTEINDRIQPWTPVNRRLILLASMLLATTAIAEELASSIEGVWLSEDGTGLIRIELGEDGPVGTIAGSPNDPDQRKSSDKDDLNPDPALRDRPLLGLTIMENFTSAGGGKWKNGKIYDPNSGKTYKCKLTLVDANTLELRGYIGISLLGRTETWNRRD